MIGMIVTGHGSLAAGITSALQMIAGAPSDYMEVDFSQDESTDELRKDLKNAIDTLKTCSDGILIFCDITGGCPYKLSTELKDEYKDSRKIEVLAGMNLGMLMEANMARTFMHDLEALTIRIKNSGSREIVRYEKERKPKHFVVNVDEDEM
ncbi:MAG: PTS fructose transporter subunit IIA [Bulleidia sp.]|nr:PTS fructose transporter subunit IIA [Bulleidia sp.]